MDGHIKKDRRENLLRCLATELELLPKWARNSVLSVGRAVKKDLEPDPESLSILLVALTEARAKDRENRKRMVKCPPPSPPASQASQESSPPLATPAVTTEKQVPKKKDRPSPSRAVQADPPPSAFSGLLKEVDEEGVSDPFETFAERMTAGNDAVGRRTLRRTP